MEEEEEEGTITAVSCNQAILYSCQFLQELKAIKEINIYMWLNSKTILVVTEATFTLQALMPNSDFFMCLAVHLTSLKVACLPCVKPHAQFVFNVISFVQTQAWPTWPKTGPQFKAWTRH